MATMIRALIAVAILAAASLGVAQQRMPMSDDPESYWLEKIQIELTRAEQARRDIAKLEGEITRAKRSRYPRGEALREKIEALELAREESAKAEALIPDLMDQARRAGVSPGALRHFE